MQHLAILSKKLDLLNKILMKEKTIESRWYKFKKPPFNAIKENELVYFKESGMPVTAKAIVEKILFFENLNKDKIKEILLEYGKQIGVDISYFEEIKDKKFCILTFLKEPEKIIPFEINKTGYGNMSAWITMNNIEEIKRR